MPFSFALQRPQHDGGLTDRSSASQDPRTPSGYAGIVIFYPAVLFGSTDSPSTSTLGPGELHICYTGSFAPDDQYTRGLIDESALVSADVFRKWKADPNNFLHDDATDESVSAALQHMVMELRKPDKFKSLNFQKSACGEEAERTRSEWFTTRYGHPESDVRQSAFSAFSGEWVRSLLGIRSTNSRSRSRMCAEIF